MNYLKIKKLDHKVIATIRTCKTLNQLEGAEAFTLLAIKERANICSSTSNALHFISKAFFELGYKYSQLGQETEL